MNTVYSANVLANHTQFIASDLGDEMILMDLDTGDYIALNTSSADIWKKAEKEVSAQQIIDHLLEEYEVEEEVCRIETLACIEEMVQKKLLIQK